MTGLLIFFLIVDAILAFIFYREGFVTRSNMSSKYKRRFFLILIIIGVAMLLQSMNKLTYACAVAGIPATLATLFVAGMAIVMLTSKQPWR